VKSETSDIAEEAIDAANILALITLMVILSIHLVRQIHVKSKVISLKVSFQANVQSNQVKYVAMSVNWEMNILIKIKAAQSSL